MQRATPFLHKVTLLRLFHFTGEERVSGQVARMVFKVSPIIVIIIIIII